MLMVPFILTGALNLASLACVYMTFWTSLMKSTTATEDEKNADALFTFVTFGIGAMSVSFVFGPLQDTYGHKATIMFLLAEYLIFYPLIIA